MKGYGNLSFGSVKGYPKRQAQKGEGEGGGGREKPKGRTDEFYGFI